MSNTPENMSFSPIGVVHSPFDPDFTPNQPLEREGAACRIEIDEKWTEALRDLDRFRYVILLTWLDTQKKPVETLATPPWAKGKQVGLFASRSPRRPNPIGMHIVPILKIEGNVIHTYGVDVYDGTPVLDLKPYIKGLDDKADADSGWLDDVEGSSEHLMQHIQGIPHDHDHDHEHEHPSDHKHPHSHDHAHVHTHKHVHEHAHGGEAEHSHEHEHAHAHDIVHDHEHDPAPDGPHSHEHKHVHSHEHQHSSGDGHGHTHDPASDDSHTHEHVHVHTHGHTHGHSEDHTHHSHVAAEHENALHTHEHTHAHSHEHDHSSGDDHGHMHDPAPQGPHSHEHEHVHSHGHVHGEGKDHHK